jgi:hypothetical protein
MDASQYKDYVLFMLFIKYVSDIDGYRFETCEAQFVESLPRRLQTFPSSGNSDRRTSSKITSQVGSPNRQLERTFATFCSVQYLLSTFI